MKKHIILFTFLFITVFELNAQKDNELAISVENISKKWVFSDLINQKLTKAKYKETKEMLVGTFIEFKDDMTFTFSFILDLEGTWSLENNVITTVDRKGKNTWIIFKITDNEITMTRNEAEQKLIFRTY